MKHKKNQITFFQYIFLIHGVQLGVGILTLPSELAEKAGTDGWISIIIGWFISTLAGLLIVQVMKKYPNGTIIDLLTHYFGNNFNYIDSVEVRYGLPAKVFNSFYEAAKEAAISRFYGGIHFMDAIENGYKQGEKVGQQVLNKLGAKVT